MDRDEAQRAWHTLARVPGVPARFGFATATSGTDEDGDTMIVPDGIPEVPSAVDEEEVEEGIEVQPDPNQPDQPLPALTVSGPIAEGERCFWVSLPSGPMLVLGSYGSQRKLIGGAIITGGRTDQTVASTAESDLTDLVAEDCIVAHPGHLICVETFLAVTASANASLVGRIQRTEETDEGDVLGPTEVGRFLRNSSVASGQTVDGCRPVLDLPDPGSYTYTATMQSSATGFVIVTDPAATTPLWSAGIFVWDVGPLPDSFAIATA